MNNLRVKIITIGLAGAITAMAFTYNACGKMKLDQMGTVTGIPLVTMKLGAHGSFINNLKICLRKMTLKSETETTIRELPANFLNVLPTGADLEALNLLSTTYEEVKLDLDSSCSSGQSISFKNSRGDFVSTEPITLTFQGSSDIESGGGKFVLNVEKLAKQLADVVNQSGVAFAASSAIGKFSYEPDGTIVLGQPTPNVVMGLEKGLFKSGKVHISGGKVFVSQCGNNRITIYNSVPTTNYARPDVVLGQPDLTTNSANYGGLSARSLSCPNAIWTAAGKLFVSDVNNKRILIWNSIPTANYTPANVVLGQNNFETVAPITTTASTFGNVLGGGSDGTKMFIADGANHRVLIWNTIPTSNNAPANVVLGQPNFSSNSANRGGGVSERGFNTPYDVSSDGTRLFVTDFRNHRVLIYNSIPTSDSAPDVVVGQPDFSTNTINNGGQLQQLNFPGWAFASGNKLYVADIYNNRVLIWNSIPTTNFVDADVLLRQVSNLNMRKARSAHTDGTRLVVGDTDNNRVLIWNTIPTQSQVDPDVVIGQPDFDSSRPNNDNAISASKLATPNQIWTDGTRLIVADSSNNRVLIWNSMPATHATPADVVVGQADMNSMGRNCGGQVGPTERCLYHPSGVAVINNRLVVADSYNNRVLIWNSIPLTNLAPADIVLGQPSMTASAFDNGGISAQSLHIPWSIGSDGTRLAVSDQNNNRVLVWNTLPVSNQQAADLVLGQPNMNSQAANFGGIGAGTLSGPSGILFAGGKLFIADTDNNRVLIWNSIPTSNGVPADLVVGQRDFVSNSNSAAFTPMPIGLAAPQSVATDGTKLYISDFENDRIMGWNTIPTTLGAAADFVMGQPDLYSAGSNKYELTENSINGPAGLYILGPRLYICDQSNDRVVIKTLPK